MEKFKQISTKPGFLKNNGGLLFRKIKKDKFEFKTKIRKIHLNRARITHGGYICSIIDAGSGTAAHSVAKGKPCVTISLDIKFISPTPRQGCANLMHHATCICVGNQCPAAPTSL